MTYRVAIDEFLKASRNELIIDVRTPLEFEQGHIIGAKNIPIFTNEERVLVGTCYKQEGRKPAILLGFELVGTKWANFIREVEANAVSNKVFVYCWRGGMRSGAMAWALAMYGFEVYVLESGYKKYRNYVLEKLQDNFSILILSGKTGSGKTQVLHALQELGEQIIDLEGLAEHQGSSFGSLGKESQTSQEQFENKLAFALSQLDSTKRIWFESESVVIGKLVIPKNIFSQMRMAFTIDIKLTKQHRIAFLNQIYGCFPKEFLKESVVKISKRLGPTETTLTLQDIEQGDMESFINRVLVYYDKYYEIAKQKRHVDFIHEVVCDEMNPNENAKQVLAIVKQLNI